MDTTYCSIFHSSNFVSMHGCTECLRRSFCFSAKVSFIFLSVQLGFLLLACLWRFDFPPMLVLVIAILNDGNKTALIHNIREEIASC